MKIMIYKYFQRFQTGHFDLEGDILEGRSIFHSNHAAERKEWMKIAELKYESFNIL